MKKRKKNPDVCDEVCDNCKNRLGCRKRVMLGFERLAFGSTADAFRLLMSESERGDRDIGEYDLFNVSEIKKPKDGAIEIRFFDRLKALEQLADYRDDGGQAQAFLDALTAAADREV